MKKIIAFLFVLGVVGCSSNKDYKGITFSNKNGESIGCFGFKDSTEQAYTFKEILPGKTYRVPYSRFDSGKANLVIYPAPDNDVFVPAGQGHLPQFDFGKCRLHTEEVGSKTYGRTIGVAPHDCSVVQEEVARGCPNPQHRK